MMNSRWLANAPDLSLGYITRLAASPPRGGGRNQRLGSRSSLCCNLQEINSKFDARRLRRLDCAILRPWFYLMNPGRSMLLRATRPTLCSKSVANHPLLLAAELHGAAHEVAAFCDCVSDIPYLQDHS